MPESIKELFNRENKIDNEAYKKFLEGKYLSDVMRTPDALDKSEELLNDAIDIDDQFFDAYAALGMTQNLMGYVEDAEESLESAMEIAEDNNEKDSLSLIYNYMGIYYKDQKKYEKAIKNFQNGIKQQKTLHNDYMHANLLHNMSGCYSMIGQTEKMLTLLSQSQDIYDRLDETIALGNSYAEMGNAYKNINKYNDSIEYYEKAKRIFISEDMNFKYAQALILQAEVNQKLNIYDKAQLYLDEATTIGQEFDNPIMNGRILLTKAQIQSDQGNIDEALKILKDALDIFIDINNKFRTSDVLIMMGFLYLNKEDTKKAEKCYLRSKKILRRLKKTSQNVSLDILKSEIELQK